MSPVSRQAKITHIIGYVDRQRELVSSDPEEEEKYRLMLEKASILRTGVTSYRCNSVPSALDPYLALPRALPKGMKDDQEADYDYIEDFDSESPNGIPPVFNIAPDQEHATRIMSARPMYFRRHTTTDDIDIPRPGYKSRFGKLAFAFLNKGRLIGHRRHGSLPEPATKSDESASIGSQEQIRCLQTASSESHSDETKPRGTVKQMFLGAFKKTSKASSETTKDDQLYPEVTLPLHEKQLFALWPQTADLDEDFHESSSSDQSPNTVRNPWTPELTPLAKLQNSSSFNRDLIGLDDGDEDNDSQTTLQSQKVPIANLIRDLSAFGLDYVSHGPYASHKLAPLESTNDVVAAM
ncbi:hypothetical protein BGX31_008903 [Mortierella sp. GBA43]|nr:hypothetical protein BGX31_008903 [Mortierella sp. GBA43]